MAATSANHNAYLNIQPPQAQTPAAPDSMKMLNRDLDLARAQSEHGVIDNNSIEINQEAKGTKMKRWGSKNLKINTDAANKTQGQNEQLAMTA